MSFDAPLLRIRAAARILKGEFQMKQYQKPEVFYENFVLADHIAQCNYTINTADVMNCEIVKDNVGGFFGDWTNAFVKDNQECKIIGESYCYTNADGLLSLFQS